jgi:hypothetical protein
VAIISGVGFFDIPHTQNPHAGNFAELHPVTAINGPSDCQGCLSRISSLKLLIVKNAASRLCRSHNRPPQRGFAMLLMSCSGGSTTA